MYHIFFIHSSVNAHLGCLHDLAIVNGAAVNMEMHVLSWSMHGLEKEFPDLSIA